MDSGSDKFVALEKGPSFLGCAIMRDSSQELQFGIDKWEGPWPKTKAVHDIKSDIVNERGANERERERGGE